MARKSDSTISQEELYSPADEPAREDLDDARLLDLDGEEDRLFCADKSVSPSAADRFRRRLPVA